jgi:hypothetical protein
MRIGKRMTGNMLYGGTNRMKNELNKAMKRLKKLANGRTCNITVDMWSWSSEEHEEQTDQTHYRAFLKTGGGLCGWDVSNKYDTPVPAVAELEARLG